MKVGLYARVSQEEQAKGESASIEQQIAEMRALCQRNGWTEASLFVDKENYKATQAPKKGKTVNPSGERADRPAFLEMLAQLRTGMLDAIACWRDDRLVRHPRVAVAMEAVRILSAIGVKPKRTIRVALWTGEEQGLLGSRAYVENHFASRPEVTDEEELKLPSWLRKKTWPISTTKEHDRLSVYFNLDNGTGRIRGVYTQGNTAVAPIFAAWLEPFHDLEADTVTHRNTGGTDHLAFDGVGLPGFQFIQDRIDYSTRTHHTNMDTLDHVKRADLIQASTIIASFVYHAAMRDEKLPRKPIPRKPAD